MGYQALLFCPDEKMARVVTQVFTELDFQVEAVSEPFGAVKKLMAQRYDAVVVDCENEQNATLLFKSARNSSSNQSSLALALVEGQAGVAKAYRIGANLVLTKPINVEQAKGTLRVARGLLRKNAEAAGTSTASPAPVAASKPAPAPGIASVKPLSRPAEPITKPKNIYEAPEFEPSQPSMAAAALESPASSIVSKLPAQVPPETGEAAKLAAASAEPRKRAAAEIASLAAGKSGSGAAAAPAPAKEVPAPAEKKKAEPEFYEVEESGIPSGRAAQTAAPSFGVLESEPEEGSGGAKKFLLIAAVMLVVAGVGYFGMTKFGKASTSTPAQQSNVATPAPSAPVPAAPSNATTTVTATPVPEASTPATPPAKPSGVAVNSSPAKASAKSEAAVEPDVTVKKIEPTPIRVKTQAASAVAPKDEAAAQIPSPLSVGSDNEKTLSKLVASTPSLPKQAISTLKISQGVSQGLVISRVQPRYPQNALSMRIQGAVQLQAVINREGKITNLKVLSGDPVLARAAVDAVRQWRYKPYYLDGDPVEIETQITVNFKLPN